jgi:hypothetical protein
VVFSYISGEEEKKKKKEKKETTHKPTFDCISISLILQHVNKMRRDGENLVDSSAFQKSNAIQVVFKRKRKCSMEALFKFNVKQLLRE